MHFESLIPAGELTKLIKNYWFVSDEDPSPRKQKIVPDGFPEIIFHYGDAFRINLHGQWEMQSSSLLAGQIKKHFFLENTGRTGVTGIKFQPTALTHLFGVDMSLFTDKVLDLKTALGNQLNALESVLCRKQKPAEWKEVMDDFFCLFIQKISYRENPADEAVHLIFEKKGMVSVGELTQKTRVSERQLERLFKKYIGLPPKFYARIIRFNQVFAMIKENQPGWCDIAFGGGYFDQSHFIRNFRQFTGEEPTAYPFFEKNLANFFLKRLS